MRRLIPVPAALLVGFAANAALATPSTWHFNFKQGTAEYAVGDFREGHDHLAFYCAEGGLTPGPASILLTRAGVRPPAGTPATFVTDADRITIILDADGSADWARLPAAAPFRALWRLIATGKRLQVRYGRGAPIIFPLAGAAKLLGPKPCPKQLAR